MGTFTITAYCRCKICNGKWIGQKTANGKDMRQGHTIATDPSIIPLGSKIKMMGQVYTAEDTGSAIKGNRIDLFVESHSKALEFGKKEIEVFRRK